ncbi:hypothetical protein ACFV9C_03935 [Kribbella sp. NPDC059898]
MALPDRLAPTAAGSPEEQLVVSARLLGTTGLEPIVRYVVHSRVR